MAKCLYKQSRNAYKNCPSTDGDSETIINSRRSISHVTNK